jgi:hypothetical protein
MMSRIRIRPGLYFEFGIEHHREAMAVGDAGEDRDHFLVAFQRVNIDGVPAVGKRRGAGAANKVLDAGVGEHVRQLLFSHPQRLDAEEPVEQPRDVGL